VLYYPNMDREKLTNSLMRAAPFIVLGLILLGSGLIDVLRVGRIEFLLFKLPLLALALMGLVKRPLYVVAGAAAFLLAAYAAGHGERILWTFYPIWIVGGFMLLLKLFLALRVRVIGR